MRFRFVCVLVMMLAVCRAGVAAVPAFDSAEAFGYLKAQCDFGPRPPGVPAHIDTLNYLARELKKCTDTVNLQSFRYNRDGGKWPMTNIIGVFGDTSKPGLLLCAHWDTRPTADQELDPARKKLPIIGADDGASGVAVLLELAQMFHKSPPAVPVMVVFFDGEDFGPGVEDMFLGARYFATKLVNKSLLKYGILLDMIGNKNVRIRREGYSQAQAKSVVDRVWNAGIALGYSKYFVNEVKEDIQDDHVPLLKAGVPCIDVIDLDYPYWHTLGDTPDKCDPQSLKVVGDTIARVVYAEKP
jgi:Zn-dependent M28 family amino/carboxypeptidase